MINMGDLYQVIYYNSRILFPFQVLLVEDPYLNLFFWLGFFFWGGADALKQMSPGMIPYTYICFEGLDFQFSIHLRSF